MPDCCPMGQIKFRKEARKKYHCSVALFPLVGGEEGAIFFMIAPKRNQQNDLKEVWTRRIRTRG